MMTREHGAAGPGTDRGKVGGRKAGTGCAPAVTLERLILVLASYRMPVRDLTPD